MDKGNLWKENYTEKSNWFHANAVWRSSNHVAPESNLSVFLFKHKRVDNSDIKGFKQSPAAKKLTSNGSWTNNHWDINSESTLR